MAPRLKALERPGAPMLGRRSGVESRPAASEYSFAGTLDTPAGPLPVSFSQPLGGADSGPLIVDFADGGVARGRVDAEPFVALTRASGVEVNDVTITWEAAQTG